MCGACGGNGAGHWSVPFLASVPARSAAAKAVTAMVGGWVAVTGTAAGYLVAFPTGRRQAVADLGEVWNVLLARGFRGSLFQVDLRGPATMPAPRAELTSVVLVEQGFSEVAAVGDLDARGLHPTDVVDRLNSMVGARRSPELRVLVRKGETLGLLPHLRAHPTRPFAVIELAGPSAAAPNLRPGHLPGEAPGLGHLPGEAPEPDYLPRLPSLLSWLAAVDVSTATLTLRLRLPVGGDGTLVIDVHHGTLTRCEVQPAESGRPRSVLLPPIAVSGPGAAAGSPTGARRNPGAGQDRSRPPTEP